MLLLRDEELCGVDIMKRLKIRSPGTIYPVLEELRKRQLLDYRVEASGASRSKRYFLTPVGMQGVREYFLQPARQYCCDAILHFSKILGHLEGLVEIKPRQKVLCTLEYEEIKRFLRRADVTYSSDSDVPHDAFDLALSFLGVGCLIGKSLPDLASYVKVLFQSLKPGGLLLAIDIEKTDNIFAKMYFEDIFGMMDAPGLPAAELGRTLEGAGFQTPKIECYSGLLFAVAKKA